MKKAHLNELISVSTRGGTLKVNPMDTLPKFTPGEGHYEGSLVQKFDHEVPVEFEDHYFQLMFTDEMVQNLIFADYLYCSLPTYLTQLLTHFSLFLSAIHYTFFLSACSRYSQVLTSYFLNDATLLI
jgi:hypothetical protein